MRQDSVGHTQVIAYGNGKLRKQWAVATVQPFRWLTDRPERTDAAVGILSAFNGDMLKVQTPLFYLGLVPET